MSDCLDLILTDTLLSGPDPLTFLSNSDARGAYLASLGQCMHAIANPRQQAVALFQCASSLTCRQFPGMPVLAMVGYLCREWQLDQEQLTQALTEIGD